MPTRTRTKPLLAIAFFTASLVLAKPAPAQRAGDESPRAAQGSSGSNEAQAGAGVYEGSPLGPGDALQIAIYRQKDASGEYSVDESGHVALPLVDRVDVRGKSLPKLKAELTEAYGHYFQHPSIQVTPLYRINVLGEIRQPGLHRVDLTMTLPDVVALAGGLTSSGTLKKVALLRAGREVNWDLSDPEVRTRAMGELGLRSGDQIMVGEKGKGFWQTAPIVASVLVAGATLFAVGSN